MESRSNWKTVAHMLGFGLLVAVIVLVAKGPPGDRDDLGRVVFAEADLAHVLASFERTKRREPTAHELRNAFQQYVRNEIFYREALARDLDRNDPVVKQSLVRKITLLGTAQARANEPTDAELQAYFELRAERYRTPASFDLMQVYLSRDARGPQAVTDAAAILDRLREEDIAPEELAGLGDRTMLPNVVSRSSAERLERTFGTVFKNAILLLPVGRWEGPIESTYGVHVVKITRRVEPRIPAWTEVRRQMLSDMQAEGERAAEDQFFAEILPRYEIVYSDGVMELLEPPDGQGIVEE